MSSGPEHPVHPPGTRQLEPWSGSGPISRSSGSGPLTDEFDATPPAPGAGARRTCLIEQGTANYSDTLQPLLRRRLLMTTGIASGALLLFLLLWLIGDARYLSTRLWPHLGLTVVNAGAAVVLLFHRGAPTGLLRGIELVSFGGAALFMAWVNFEDLRVRGWALAAGGAYPLGVMSFSASLSWFSLITLYGIFIPNVGRRTAWITASMGLIALAGVIGSAAAAVPPPTFDTARQVVLLVTVWMGMALAIAAFGSSRIAALSREAFEARQLGRYCLRKKLGEGGMGEVHLAEHRFLQRPCAIKLIKPEVAGKPIQLMRFEREVQITARLTHPNTVEIFDFGRTADGRFYYVMEYLPGLSLGRIVSEHGPLPAARVVHVLRQVCGALHEAHAGGVIHRDIKPGNIMLCERGMRFDVAKVLDFGLVRAPECAAAADGLTQEGTFVGTPAYISPEQARGETDIDGRSDIYSLGATAYCLLTGEPPFLRKNSMQTLLAQIGEPPVPPRNLRPEIPADLEAVVLKCLEKSPGDRYADVNSVETALCACACANEWTQEKAADWWKSAAAAAPPGESATELSYLDVRSLVSAAG